MDHKHTSAYVAKPVDANQNADYTEAENQTWTTLITRQRPILEGRACPEFIQGLDLLDLPKNRIPQCHEVSRVLKATTGWALEPVAALIPFKQFFNLLANRKFPAATFIRRQEELDYLQEPDIFHEIFGHGPLLTNEACAEFTYAYGKLGEKASYQDQVMLAKLYWFTIEFGLINTPIGLRAYGGGILSSMSETVYCVDSPIPQHKPFDPLEALRTPYRIDVIQPIYFVINQLDDLFKLIEIDLIALIHEARALGMYDPMYPTRFE